MAVILSGGKEYAQYQSYHHSEVQITSLGSRRDAIHIPSQPLSPSYTASLRTSHWARCSEGLPRNKAASYVPLLSGKVTELSLCCSHCHFNSVISLKYFNTCAVLPRRQSDKTISPYSVLVMQTAAWYKHLLQYGQTWGPSSTPNLQHGT